MRAISAHGPSALPGARALLCRIPEEWPEGRFDLVVLSEVGYFLSPRDLDRVLERIRACLGSRGVVLACHWRHPIHGWVMDAEAVHARVEAGAAGVRLAEYRDADVEILLLGSPGGLPSPA